MGYISRGVSAATIRQIINECVPLAQIPIAKVISATEVKIYERTIDVTDIDYIHIYGTTTTDWEAAMHLKVNLDATNLLDFTSADVMEERIDISSYTGDMALNVGLYNTNAGDYTQVVNLLIIASEASY